MSILKTFRTNIKSETNAIENYVNKIEKIFAKNISKSLYFSGKFDILYIV